MKDPIVQAKRTVRMGAWIRGILALLGWLLLAFMLAVLFFPEVDDSSSGGVQWQYFAAMLLLPYGAFRVAKNVPRASLFVCYGLIAGGVFSFPCFLYDRRLMYIPVDQIGVAKLVLYLKITGLMMATTAACLAAYAGRLFLQKRRSERHLKTAVPLILVSTFLLLLFSARQGFLNKFAEVFACDEHTSMLPGQVVILTSVILRMAIEVWKEARR